MKVYIKTPARLHLGLLDLEGGLGRIFGGIGVALNYPNVILEAQPSKNLIIEGEKRTLVKSLIEHFLKSYGIEDKVVINVKQTIPEHVGLGSGTQLALAVATALAKLFLIEVPTCELAVVMGRGRVSGIGTAIFEHGGFVVEGGLKAEKGSPSTTKSFPSTIFHKPFPEDWLFIVVVPNVKRGFSDEEELSAFGQLPPMPAQDVGSVCRLTLMKLLPSLIERDIKNFGDALTQIQNIVGEYFAKVQGGTYSNSVTKECIEYMAKLGTYGMGQSSWGPAFYGLVQGKEQAEKLKENIQTFLNKRGGGQIFIAKANNKGAYIKLIKH